MLGGAIGACGLLLLSPIGSAFSTGELADNTGALTQPMLVAPATDVGAPQLAENLTEILEPTEVQAAEKIISADPFIRNLLNGRGYTIGSRGVWASADGIRIGADMELRLSSSLSANTAWPRTTPLNVPPYYAPTTYPMTVRDVTTLDVLVDLKLHRLTDVSVNPLSLVDVGADGPANDPTQTGVN